MKHISNEALFNKKFTASQLAKTLEIAPHTIWQYRKKSNENFYLHYLVTTGNATMLSVIKPGEEFGKEVAEHTTVGRNLVHLASIHGADERMFEALKPLLDLAIEQNPNLLLSKDSEGKSPLWTALAYKNLPMARYLLEKFSEKYAMLTPSGDVNVFREMYLHIAADKKSAIALYDIAEISEFKNLLKEYGADVYSQQPEKIDTYLQTEGRLRNIPYWVALLQVRSKERHWIAPDQKNACEVSLAALDVNASTQLDPKEVVHKKQLRDLAIYLENETVQLEAFVTADTNRFMNRYVRNGLHSASRLDLKEMNLSMINLLEFIAWGGYMTALVYMGIFNNEMFTERSKMVSELRTNEEYENCMYYHQETGYSPDPVKREVPFTKGCLKAPSTFEGRCTEDPFISAYRSCYYVGLICLFHTFAMVALGIGLLIPSQGRNLSWRLRLPQELLKSPIYLACYLVGEVKPLMSFPAKFERHALYKELIELLLTVYVQGDSQTLLNEQLVVLNKPMDEISAESLQGVLTVIKHKVADYDFERDQTILTIEPQKLVPVIQRLCSLAQFDLKDVERNTVGTPMRFSLGVYSASHVAINNGPDLIANENSRLLPASPRKS